MAKIQDVLYGTNVRKMKSRPTVTISNGEFVKPFDAGGLYLVSNGGEVDGVQYNAGDLIINFGDRVEKFGSGGSAPDYNEMVEMTQLILRPEWHKHTLRVLVGVDSGDLETHELNLDNYSDLPVGYTVAFLFAYEAQLRFSTDNREEWGLIQGPEGPQTDYVNAGVGTSLAIEKVDENVWSISGRAFYSRPPE